MRGTRLDGHCRRFWRRFIPAHAGNSHKEVSSGDQTIGSSPRMRGTQAERGRDERRDRFIPAHAGNSNHLHRPAVQHPVHPRACGELPVVVDEHGLDAGSSPRMRGTLKQRGLIEVGRRFIPAHAGNSLPATNKGFLVYGSSPRMRGTPDEPGRGALRHRFIPAHAGNSLLCDLARVLVSVHPRACGELYCLQFFLVNCCGSSPRMRGTQ